MGVFTEAEYVGRLERAKQALAEDDMGGAICVSPETLTYLSGYNGYTYWTDQALVVPLGVRNPTLVLRDVDRPLADESTWIRDIRYYRFGRDDPAKIVAEVARANGITSGSIGLEKQAYALPAGYAERIEGALGSTKAKDCSRLLARLRVTKSEAELGCVREAGKMTSSAMQAAIDAIQPGLSEVALASVIEGALREAGSEYSAMPTMVGTGPRSAAMHATPTRRVIEDGDPVLFYFAGVRERYHVTGYRTVHVGDPSPRFEEVYSAAEAALDAVSGAVAVGTPVSEAARAGATVLQSRGQAHHQVARWGYGVGTSYPPVWLEAFDVVEESDDRFRPGTVMCLHVCMSLPEEGFGLMVGRDHILTSEGLEPLDDMPSGLVVV